MKYTDVIKQRGTGASRFCLSALLGAVAFTLAACGGGGYSEPPATGGSSTPAPTVSGTAATGAAIAFGAVTLKCVSGTVNTVLTGTDGSFTVNVAKATLPCIGRVSYQDAGGADQVLHTFIRATGTANITPVTDLLVAALSGGTAADAFSNFNADKADAYAPVQVSAAVEAVRAYLQTKFGVDMANLPADPIGTPFKAQGGGSTGDAFDKLLDALQVQLKLAGKTLADVAADMRNTPLVPLSCGDLRGKAIPAAAIGIETGGAVVTATKDVAASGTGTAAISAHCLATGIIFPVDLNAPNITFQLALPAEWNRKALMYGGGGFNGSVPVVTGPFPQAPVDSLTPLARGYAVFGSDSGHQAGALGSQDGSFAANDESLRNFAGDALKKTRDTAIFLIMARYGSKTGPEKSYVTGGSTGGRETLTAIQRWPADWDGAIAWYPAWNNTSALLAGIRNSRAISATTTYPSSANRQWIYRAAIYHCDLLDGVADELISNPKKCNEEFNPMKAMYIPPTGPATPRKLSCSDGGTNGSCLTDAQITALTTMNTTATFSFTLASGDSDYPGFNMWGSDLGITSVTTAEENLVSALALGWTRPIAGNPMAQGGASYPPYITQLADQWWKYFVTKNPLANSLATTGNSPIDPDEATLARLNELSLMIDSKPDISAFKARGGKLLMAHGVHDVLVSTRGSERYWQKLQNLFGADNMASFARFYLIPGFGHSISTTFNATWDSLTALEQWTEKSVAPVNQVVTDSYRTPTRTRPLCDYPKWPKYNEGDSTLAASFTCVDE